MSHEHQDDWNEIVRLSNLDDDASREKLTKYVMEGCRLSTIAPQLNRVVTKDTIVNDGGKQIVCKAGDIIFLNLVPSHPCADSDCREHGARRIFRPEKGQSRSACRQVHSLWLGKPHVFRRSNCEYRVDGNVALLCSFAEFASGPRT
jgi:hypothetical protein